MSGNIINNVKEEINKFVAKEIIIKQYGFITSIYSIKKLKCFLEYDVLTIKDEISINCIKINLNQIYKIENDIEKLKIYLDNDTTITLEIKR